MAPEPLLSALVLVADGDESDQLAVAVGVAALEHIHQRAMVELEAAAHGLGAAVHEAEEDLLVPGDVALLRRLGLVDLDLLSAAVGLGLALAVLDHMLGRLADDPAAVVEPFAARPPGDLFEVADGEEGDLLAVELAELGEDDGSDGDIDANAERVGAGDDLEESGLCEPLDEESVLGEEAGVVDADAGGDEAAERGAEGAVEAEAGELFADAVAGILVGDVGAGEVLAELGGLALGEADDVDGGATAAEEVCDGLVEEGLFVGELERDGALLGLDERDGAAGACLEVLLDEGDIAERGRHEEEAAAGQGEERDLPGRTAVAVGVVVELVHDDVVDAGLVAEAEGHLGEHLCGAAEDGRGGVDGGVARHHAHLLGAEELAEGEELLADQRLDGGGVDGGATLAEGEEVVGGCDERFPRAGGRVEDDRVALHDLEDGLFLCRVEFGAGREDKLEEVVEGLFGREAVGGRVDGERSSVEDVGHGPRGVCVGAGLPCGAARASGAAFLAPRGRLC